MVDDSTLMGDLTKLLNSYSQENQSNTPDFILAQYMMMALTAFELAVKSRDRWYDIHPSPGGVDTRAFMEGLND